MQHYSFVSLVRNAVGHHEGWQEAWRSPPPKPAYSVVIVGGGGHGLATAYYLAKEHGVSDVAVLEKGWLGGGNTARNTTHVRSDYILDENAHFYEASVKLWEGLSRRLELQRDVQPARHDPHRALRLPDAGAPAPRQRDAIEWNRRRFPFT